MKYLYPLLITTSFFLLQGRISSVQAQGKDSIKTKQLEEILVTGIRSNIEAIKRLDPVNETYITLGKKNEVIMVQDLPANLAEKSGRQIFAKVPGVFIYDMDGSGNQMNISTRGLDPHRSWEYNIRQNGIMTNSDIY